MECLFASGDCTYSCYCTIVGGVTVIPSIHTFIPGFLNKFHMPYKNAFYATHHLLTFQNSSLYAFVACMSLQIRGWVDGSYHGCLVSNLCEGREESTAAISQHASGERHGHHTWWKMDEARCGCSLGMLVCQYFLKLMRCHTKVDDQGKVATTLVSNCCTRRI